MSILMSSMHSFSHYDPFNTQSYLFDNNQEHYLQPTAPFSPPSYATPHPFPVDPRWFNTSFSGHATAAPHQFSPMTHSVITPPQLQTDLLSLSPSSTIAPIPPLSGSHNRPRSMSNRIRSFNPSTRLARPSSGSARGPQNNNQRIARRSTVSSSSPSLGGGHNQHSPIMGMHSSSSPSTSYLHSPTTTLEHEATTQPDSHETRASKRRRTDDVDSASLHSYSTVPEPPHLLTPTQPPHLALIHGHGYPPSQTWAGPPSAGHIPHGLSPDHHGGYTQWPPAPLAYFTPDQGLSDHHHLHHNQQQQQHNHHHPLSATSDASHTPILPYPSPTVAGPGFFNSPEPEAPMSAVESSTHFQFHKMEPDSPRLLEDVQPSFDSFEHGPTDFPPRAYPGGVDAKSPWVPTKHVGKIFGSRLEQVSFSLSLKRSF